MVAERQATVHALRESEQQLRNLIEGSIQGILIYSPDYRPLFVNQAYADMLGCASPNEILAMASVATFFTRKERSRLRAYEEA